MLQHTQITPINVFFAFAASSIFHTKRNWNTYVTCSKLFVRFPKLQWYHVNHWRPKSGFDDFFPFWHKINTFDKGHFSVDDQNAGFHSFPYDWFESLLMILLDVSLMVVMGFG